MANVTLFSGQCSIEYLAVSGSQSMYLPVLPFDKSNITSSNYSNFTLSVTVNNNAILTDAPFIDSTHINKRSGGPRGTIQTYQAGSIGWGVRVYDSTGATINFTTSDTVTMTLVGPEEFAPTPGPEPSTGLIFSNIQKIEISRLTAGYTEQTFLASCHTYYQQDADKYFWLEQIPITQIGLNDTVEFTLVADCSLNYQDSSGNFVPVNYQSDVQSGSLFALTDSLTESNARGLYVKQSDLTYWLQFGYIDSVTQNLYTSSMQITDVNWLHKLKFVVKVNSGAVTFDVYDLNNGTHPFESGELPSSIVFSANAVRIFGRYISDSLDTRTKAKLYSATLKVNNTLQFDLLPAIDSQNNTVMYDRINDESYSTNQYRGSADINVPVGGDVVNEVIKIEDYYNGALRTLWSKAASPTPSTVEPLSYDDTIVWTVGTGVANSNGYYYYPLTANGETGVQIALADNPLGWNSDGKPSMNTEYSWKVKFPSAGWYQMVVTAGYSSSGANANFAAYNKVDIDGMGSVSSYYSYSGVDPTSNLNIQIYTNSQGSDYDAPGILVFPNVNYSDVPNFVMTQGGATPTQIVLAIVYVDDATVEHTITYKSTSYRLVFDSSSNIVFRKLNNYTPPANPNS